MSDPSFISCAEGKVAETSAAIASCLTSDSVPPNPFSPTSDERIEYAVEKSAARKRTHPVSTNTIVMSQPSPAGSGRPIRPHVRQIIRPKPCHTPQITYVHPAPCHRPQ